MIRDKDLWVRHFLEKYIVLKTEDVHFVCKKIDEYLAHYKRMDKDSEKYVQKYKEFYQDTVIFHEEEIETRKNSLVHVDDMVKQVDTPEKLKKMWLNKTEEAIEAYEVSMHIFEKMEKILKHMRFHETQLLEAHRVMGETIKSIIGTSVVIIESKKSTKEEQARNKTWN